MDSIAGILLLILSLAHVVYGERKLLPDLASKLKDPFLVGSMRVMSMQGGVLLLLIAMLQLSVAGEVITLSGRAQFIPVVLVVANVLTFLVVTLIKHPILLRYTIPQMGLFGLVILLMLLSL